MRHPPGGTGERADRSGGVQGQNAYEATFLEIDAEGTRARLRAADAERGFGHASSRV
ncbi:hypothetical protein GCM10023347_30720 [Streptomyces chumphonensis]|uniref:Uncharacterized protein n=1 Tax=Streptomyces chumphonensis TaxID=1214925 RepID=A0A927F2B3_9ACTN|nr:hypothetical protein [Streptomyces chumphonensis]MBD3933710.1 hypothetical protein [Streptomyces chumphonensis]